MDLEVPCTLFSDTPMYMVYIESILLHIYIYMRVWVYLYLCMYIIRYIRDEGCLPWEVYLQQDICIYIYNRTSLTSNLRL